MKLRLMARGAWTVLAARADDEPCDVLEFTDQLRCDDPREYARLMQAFDRVAEYGPPRNVRRSRALAHGILEMKTSGGTRVFFFDEDRLVVYGDAMQKPKRRGLAQAAERAARTRWRCLSDNRRGNLKIVEDR